MAPSCLSLSLTCHATEGAAARENQDQGRHHPPYRARDERAPCPSARSVRVADTLRKRPRHGAPAAAIIHSHGVSAVGFPTYATQAAGETTPGFIRSGLGDRRRLRLSAASRKHSTREKHRPTHGRAEQLASAERYGTGSASHAPTVPAPRDGLGFHILWAAGIPSPW